jgi:hypothetical protein
LLTNNALGRINANKIAVYNKSEFPLVFTQADKTVQILTGRNRITEISEMYCSSSCTTAAREYRKLVLGAAI